MLLAQLEAAALAPDCDALREAAHSLKSSSANLGAMALSAAAKRVELGARMQTLDRPAVAVAMVVERVRTRAPGIAARCSASARRGTERLATTGARFKPRARCRRRELAASAGTASAQSSILVSR